MKLFKRDEDDLKYFMYKCLSAGQFLYKKEVKDTSYQLSNIDFIYKFIIIVLKQVTHFLFSEIQIKWKILEIHQ